MSKRLRKAGDELAKVLTKVSKRGVQDLLDAIEADFAWCLESVLALEGNSVDESVGERIVGFQTRLFDAISKLDDAYREIKREEKRLIKRKEKLNSRWFRNRMANLADYREALRQAMQIGRSVGDGFAWIFYENNRELIAEHLKHQFQPLLPPGTGRVGERACLDAFRYVDGHFQLYHGITTFLRMGDCSFVHLDTLRVTAIGEIKTKHVGGDRYQSSMDIVSKSGDGLPNFSEILSEGTASAQNLDSHVEKRRKRQIGQMAEAIAEQKRDKNDQSVEAIKMEFIFDSIDEVVKNATVSRAAYTQVSDGMMVCAIRLRNDGRLSQALISSGKQKVDLKLEGVPKAALEIMVPDDKRNSLHLGTIGFGDDNLVHQSDGFPFVLWPISPQAMKDVIFGRVLIVTCFNPLPFQRALEQRGYSVSVSRKLVPNSASKIVDRRRLKLENLNYYLGLIQRAGVSEVTVLSMIDQMTEVAEASHEGGGLRLQIAPQIHRFRPPN